MASRDIGEPQHSFRFLDADEEPQTILTPIQDYENIPLVSLNKAIVPLASIIFDVKQMVQTVKANYSESEDGLTKDESNSIRLYSLEWQPKENSLFYILNKALRSENRQQLKPWFLFLKLLLSALSHLSGTSLTVYRSINMDLATRYSTGTTVVWWGFSSCMKKSNLLEKRLFLNKTGKRTLFIITCYSGKDIHRHSMYEGEGEVLLPPACQFNILNPIDKGNGLRIIELKEISPAYDYFNAFLSQTDISTNAPLYNIHFQPISTVSLSKKSLPAALPNVRLEEQIAYIKQRSKAGLKSMNLTDPDIDIIVSEIIMKKQCSELDLSSNKITYNGVLFLAHALRKNKTLTTLYLVKNQIGEKGAQYLAEALGINMGLTTLSLRHNQMGSKGMQYLAEALRTNTTLTTLNISANEIGDKGTEYLSETLRTNMTLTTVDLNWNRIGEKGAQYLGEALKINTILTTLDLSSNGIAAKGALYLSEALRTNTSLTILNLGCSHIGDKGAQYISEALQTNTTLTTLDLTLNKIEVGGAVYLCEALRINKTLTALNLGHNEIGQIGAQRLVEALRTNTTLTTLDLTFNKIGTEGISYLTSNLRQKKSLIQINFAGNEINYNTEII